MLIDKSKAPTYRLLPADTPDKLLLVFSAGTLFVDMLCVFFLKKMFSLSLSFFRFFLYLLCLFYFVTGPPYEDIAFKIVNAEWATGKRSGFRCKFQNGVLQLHFNLKFYRYRK